MSDRVTDIRVKSPTTIFGSGIERWRIPYGLTLDRRWEDPLGQGTGKKGVDDLFRLRALSLALFLLRASYAASLRRKASYDSVRHGRDLDP